MVYFICQSLPSLALILTLYDTNGRLELSSATKQLAVQTHVAGKFRREPIRRVEIIAQTRNKFPN
jgi:hypothetical protein